MTVSPTALLHRIVPPGEGELIEIGANRIRVILDAEATGGTLTLLDYEVPAGFPGPSLHVHPSFDETFAVMTGRLELRVGDSAVTAAAGTVVHVSGDEPHTFANPADAPARVLIVVCPGGFEAYFRELAVAAAGAGGMPDPAIAAALSAAHGVHPVHG